MINNRQGGEALINFVASRYKKGGPVAAFQVGGDVNDYESEAYGVGSSVSSTAASEDIGTVDEDRGPGDPPGEVFDDSDDPAPASTPPTEPAPEEPSDSGDSIVSSLTTEQLEKAVDAIEKAKYPSAVEQDMLANARAELSARKAIASGLLEDEKTVTQAAIEKAVQPIDYLSGALADASTPMTSGAFVDSLGRGVMADISPTAAPTGSLMGASGAATDILGGYDRAMAEQRALANRDRMAAEMAAARGGVDADDMAGIAAAAPPSTVQAPTDGIGAVLTEGYDMAGRPTIPGISDDDVDQGSADVGALAKELGIDVKDVDFGKRGLANLLEPGGILKDIGGLFTGEGALKEAAAGGQVVKNEKGETVGVVSYDDEGKVSKVTPVGIKESFDPALKDAYRDFYANQPEERDSDSGEPILPEDVETEEEEAPKKPPTVDIIPFRPQDFAYFTPGNFAYNRGLPSMMNMRKG